MQIDLVLGYMEYNDINCHYESHSLFTPHPCGFTVNEVCKRMDNWCVINRHKFPPGFSVEYVPSYKHLMYVHEMLTAKKLFC